MKEQDEVRLEEGPTAWCMLANLNIAYRRGYIDLTGSDGNDEENSGFTRPATGTKERHSSSCVK